jgi:hypothetical protein
MRTMVHHCQSLQWTTWAVLHEQTGPLHGKQPARHKHDVRAILADEDVRQGSEACLTVR